MKYVRITMPPGDWVAGGFTHLIAADEKIPPIPRDQRPGSMSEDAFRHYVGLVNYYIHQVNLMRHLLGEDYAVTHAEPAGLLMIVRSHSGVTGTIEMAPYSTTIDWQEEALVCFERGWIRIQLPAPMAVDRPGKVIVYSDRGKGAEPCTIIPRLPHVHAMRQQAINFIKAVRGERTPLCTAEDALKDLEAMRDYLDLFIKAGGTVAS
jgi:predicted dehydrogenase